MVYRNTVFSDEDLKGKQFSGDVLVHVAFRGLRLRFTDFRTCELRVCDFSGAVFDGCSFRSCRFPESKLSHLDFSEAAFTACDFSAAVMENSTFRKLSADPGGKAVPCDLRKCSFEKTVLSNTVFIRCDLREVGFRNALMDGAVFERCNLNAADLTGADISGVNFTDSKTDGTILDMQGFLHFGNSKGFRLGAPVDTTGDRIV